MSLPCAMSQETRDSLMESLLDCAVLSAGFEHRDKLPKEERLHRRSSQDPPSSPDHSSSPIISIQRLDSRGGLANTYEFSPQTNQSLSYQDVEVCLHATQLLCNLVILSPSRFVVSFNNLKHLTTALLQLLIYAPSSRIRKATNSYFSSLLFVLIQCCQPCNESEHSRFCHSEPHIHTAIKILCQALFKARLPLWSLRTSSLRASNLPLVLNCLQFFQLKGILAGSLPPAWLNNHMKTHHFTILQDEIKWLKSFRFSESESIARHSLDENLFIGHLSLISGLLAQMTNSIGVSLHCSAHTRLRRSSLFATHSHKKQQKISHQARSLIDEKSLDAHCTASVELLRLIFSLKVEQEYTSNLEPFITPLYSASCVVLCRPLALYLLTELLFPASRLMLSPRKTALSSQLLDLSNNLDPVSSLPEDEDDEEDVFNQDQLWLESLDHSKFLELHNKGRKIVKNCFAFLILVSHLDARLYERVVRFLILVHHQNEERAVYAVNESSEVAHGPLTLVDSKVKESTRMRKHLHQQQFKPNDAGFVGLRNGGATCYMNSILQCLFMQPGVPEALLSITDSLEAASKHSQDFDPEKTLLYQTQQLFAHLMKSTLKYYDPQNFWAVLRFWGAKESINPREQQDAFDFFETFTDQLDEELKKMCKEPYFRQVYQGTFSDSIDCEDCNHSYEHEQEFTALSVDVKSRDLIEALHQFVRSELLDADNAYFCVKCQQKRAATKRLRIKTLPAVLCLQLKRFEYNWTASTSLKNNDYFVFPRHLDMSPYLSSGRGAQSGTSASFQSSQMAETLVDLNRSDKMSTLTNIDQIDTAHVQLSANFTNPSKRQFHLQDTDEKNEFFKPFAKTSEPVKFTSGTSTTSSEDEAVGPVKRPRQSSEESNSNKPCFHIQQPVNCVSKDEKMCKQIDTHYHLVAVVVHSGQANAGHYYAYIRDRGRCIQK
ncbi:Ubiquitin carboxyl-terminal hydrolase 24 [Cichlidogyrus casuarinus]|uniref:Ubiquitin carboxyl-terminal hydrolase n=1 Tax=Cichlidogyrus casuarinus TaxID=1844966 RepID=A0ABD2QIY7_9PLAT